MGKYLTERQMNANFLLRDGDYRDIRDMLERLNVLCADRRLLAGLDSNKNIFYYTGHDFYEEIMNLGDGFISLGLKGAHIAIVADNSCRYVVADTCISSGVGVVTPVDVEAPVELLATLLAKCDANAVLCSARCISRIEEAAEKCPLLKTIITIDKKVEGYPFYDELVEAGKNVKDSVYRKVKLDQDAPAKILFTSGTTGANKGVVLSNANLAANIVNCMDVIKAEEGNTSMSVLPMHHATEINTHVLTRIACGKLTYINDNMRNMMANMKIFKPQIITIVPMIANAFYKNIWAGARKSGSEEKLRKGIKLCNILRKFGKDKTHELFKAVYEPFGGNLSMIVCGGAMLNPVVVKGMNDLGIRMENGYGITECGPLISMNADTLNEWQSVGKPCPGLEAKIDKPDENGVGELCVRGRSVSKGYYKDPEATAAVFDADGFFHTGDSARIDSKGKIFLVGRKKNTIILESGKNVCPEEIENVIETNLDYAGDIVVYQADYEKGGVSRKVLVAGLYIADEAKRGEREAIAADIKRVNAILPAYKNIDYVELPDAGYEKTSSHKIRRTTLPDKCSGTGIEIN